MSAVLPSGEVDNHTTYRTGHHCPTCISEGSTSLARLLSRREALYEAPARGRVYETAFSVSLARNVISKLNP